jgi:hypothetical protein
MYLKLLAYLSVIAGAMLKFIFGPLAGFSTRLSFVETWLFTVVGMMCSVSTVLIVGTPLRQWLVLRFGQNQKKFTPRKRMIVRIWKSYGLIGIAALTPLILTPLGGSIIAVALGGKPKVILLYMFASATAWGGVLSGVVFVFGSQVQVWLQ